LGFENQLRRWAVSSVAVLVIVIILMATVAGGYYVLTSGQGTNTQSSTSSSTSRTSSTSRSTFVVPLSSSSSSTSGQTTPSSTSSSVSTSSPTSSESFFGAAYLNLQGSGDARDLFGNYSQMSFNLRARSLNSSGFARLNSSYSVVGRPVLNGVQTTELNFTSVSIVSGTGFGGFGLFKSFTSHSSVWLAQNRTIVQVDVNGTMFTSGDLSTPFQEAAAGIIYIGSYALATPLFMAAAGNSTLARVANTSSIMLGSTRLSVTTVVSTSAYPIRTVVSLGIAQGAILYVPTFFSYVVEANPGDTGSWVVLTDILVSVSTA
jgi:hypothetical protein